MGGRCVGGRYVRGRYVGGRNVGGKCVGGRCVGGRCVGGRCVGGRNVGHQLRVKRDQVSVKKDLVSVKRDLVSIKRDLIKRPRGEGGMSAKSQTVCLVRRRLPDLPPPIPGRYLRPPAQSNRRHLRLPSACVYELGTLRVCECV